MNLLDGFYSSVLLASYCGFQVLWKRSCVIGKTKISLEFGALGGQPCALARGINPFRQHLRDDLLLQQRAFGIGGNQHQTEW